MLNKGAAVLVVASVIWLAFTLSSTDSEAVVPTFGGVVINELMYHPASGVDGEEYVELTNTSVVTVDLSGWWFSDGIDYAFPSGTTLAPGDFLVIAHTPEAVASKYGLDPVELLGPFTAKRLSDAGERVTLSDAAGGLVDEVMYDDDSPWPDEPDGQGASLELVNPNLDNDRACAWAASSGPGTPKAQNSVYALDIPPCVMDVIHAPVFPTSSQKVLVTANIDDNSVVTLAQVYYREDENVLFDSTAMVDDGGGGDLVAGDGIYTAQLPPFSDGSLVEFFVEAKDDAGLTMRVPINAPGSTSPETGGPVTIGYLFLVEDVAPASVHPIYRLLVTEENWTELTTRDINSNELLDATFVYDGEVFYGVGLRYRGESSRSLVPRSFRIDFSSTGMFNGVERLNLVGDHISREALTYDLFQRAGMVASNTEFVDLYINTVHQALYITIEQVDEVFLSAHFAGDDTGNLYRAQDGGDLSYRGLNPDDYRAYYIKKNNEAADDYSDVIMLTDVLDNSPEEGFSAVAGMVADIPQWLRWFAINAIVFNQEGALFMGQGDDYFLYHRPSDDRFVLIPWDHDSTFYYAAGDIWAPNLSVVKRILRHPPFTRRYYWNIRGLMANEFSVATMHPLIDALPAELDEDKDQLKQFVTDRNNYLTNYFDENLPDRPLTIATNGGKDFTTTQRTIILEGGCSLWRDVYVNGSVQGVVYRSIYDWRYASPPLRPRANRFEVTDRDSEGRVVTTRTITVTFDTFDGGVLADDLTLTSDDSPHIMLDDVIVPQGRTLTIKPGATVVFAEGVSLFVEGQLLAEGTAEQPIVLTRDLDTEYWGVVGIYGSLADNRMSHVIIEYAGQDSYDGHAFVGVGAYNGQLTLEDSEIHNTSHTALNFFQSVAYVRRNWVHDTINGAALRGQSSVVEVEDNLFHGLNGGNHGLHLSDDVGSAGGVIRENIIFSVEGDCVRIDGTGMAVERNELHHCTGAGVSLFQTGSLTITNNLIRHNTVGISAGGGTKSFLAFDTLADNDVAGLVVSDKNDQVAMVNSIVWGSSVAISHTDGVSIAISYSDIQGGWPGEGNISDDPQFRSPDSVNYRLLEASPCIDRGASLAAGGVTWIDLMGVQRPKGDGYDMGAYEFFEYYAAYLPFVLNEP